MSKELEALERIKTAPSFMGGNNYYKYNTNSVDVYLQDCKIIETALQRLEAIDNAKKDINSLYSNMHQTSDELDKSLKDSLLKNAKTEAIDNANPSEALKSLEELRDYLLRDRINISSTKNYNIIEQALLKAQEDKKKADALKELIRNHIEFVVEEDRCYFKIKNSKGNEKSFTSYTMIDFWKEVLKDD